MRTHFPSGPATRVLSLLAVGVAGGAVALAGAWLAGGFDKGATTVRQVVQQPFAPTPQVAQRSRGLSISEIYDRSAPGVVQIT